MDGSKLFAQTVKHNKLQTPNPPLLEYFHVQVKLRTSGWLMVCW